MRMNDWIHNLVESDEKKAIPVLSFPCVSLLGITVRELIGNSDLQAKGMKMVADRIDSGASVSMMDLSVEAEAFGSKTRISDDEVPTVVGSIVNTEDEANALAIPAVGTGRTGLYVEAIEKACKLVTDRPVLAGVIGPFSLAGRLMDVTKALVNCVDEPDMVHICLEKTTKFLIEYINAYKAIGSNGVVMAEPLTGLLSPRMAKTFSSVYVKQIVDAVQTDDFSVIYHNCGNNTVKQAGSIFSIGAAGYHFGNSISMEAMMEAAPKDVPILGNIDPASQFRNGTPSSMRKAVLELMGTCCPKYKNFVISSGCDIPPATPWDNIDAFFAAVKEYYEKIQ